MQIRTAAVSLNYRDLLMLENGMGSPLSFPFVPGSDMAGIVEAVGSEVVAFHPGDRVIASFSPDWIDGVPEGSARNPPYKALGGFYPGVLSEIVTLPQSWLVRAPVSLSLAEASTLPCAGLTAWFALQETARIAPGQSILVQGTGGVALFGVAIARAYGAEVYVVSGDAGKRDRRGRSEPIIRSPVKLGSRRSMPSRRIVGSITFSSSSAARISAARSRPLPWVDAFR